MPLHVDRFETIIGHMPGCGYIPTTTERIDWFLPSVGEATYAAAKAHCQAKKLTGGLEYADMVKLYNHTCFEKYPHFQLTNFKTPTYRKTLTVLGGNHHHLVCTTPTLTTQQPTVRNWNLWIEDSLHNEQGKVNQTRANTVIEVSSRKKREEKAKEEGKERGNQKVNLSKENVEIVERPDTWQGIAIAGNLRTRRYNRTTRR